MGKIANRQSLAFSERGQLSQVIPQFHVERRLNEWTRFESQHNERKVCEDQILCFFDRQRTLVIRIAAMTLASDSAITLARFRPSKVHALCQISGRTLEERQRRLLGTLDATSKVPFHPWQAEAQQHKRNQDVAADVSLGCSCCPAASAEIPSVASFFFSVRESLVTTFPGNRRMTSVYNIVLCYFTCILQRVSLYFALGDHSDKSSSLQTVTLRWTSLGKDASREWVLLYAVTAVDKEVADGVFQCLLFRLVWSESGRDPPRHWEPKCLKTLELSSLFLSPWRKIASITGRGWSSEKHY